MNRSCPMWAAVALTALFAWPAQAQSEAKTAGPPARKDSSGAARAEAILDEAINRLIVQVDSHWHKGEYNHIVNLSKVIVAGDPQNLDSYANAGWLLWSMNRDAEAVALYEQGLKANPNSYYLYDELGFYYYNRKKDYRKAIEYYEQAARKSDVGLPTLHLLAHSYEHTGNLKKCLETWERCAKDSTDPIAKRHVARLRKKLGG